MKVSIITPTYNSDKYIYDTYICLVKQTHSNWEWIVTDDCSTDCTREILNRIAMEDSRVKFLQNEVNAGAAVSRNKSIDHISGGMVAFLDSDDLWDPSKLELQLAFMGDDCNFCFTGYHIMNEHSELSGRTVDTTQSGEFSYEDMLMKKATLGCSTVMIRRSFLGELRMPLLRTGQDYAYWLLLLREGNKAKVLPSALTYYRITPNSISRNKLKKAKRQWYIYRNVENISFLSSVFYFINYAVRAILRKK